ncbi:hypothetical protein ACIBQ3_19450 [Streptomyces rubiginosohelvolus]|uniref:hypothetical protein n=1 Tax=Streptomyces rubiginosohelvolus TaxID=67362 RepID=UPI00378BCEA9
MDGCYGETLRAVMREHLLRERSAPERPRAVRVAAGRLLRAAARQSRPAPGYR